MSKKNNAEMKKSNEQVANVPNPPVPNRARTEMKNEANTNNNAASRNCKKNESK